MWTYHPDLLETPVPRYTSYPTAAEFGEQVGPRDMAAALDGVGGEDELSLYLHIPYCGQICWYCGCTTGAANRSHRLAAYLDALGEEIDLVARRLDGRGRIARIAFGGGSPNAIGATDFVRLIDRIVTQLRAAGAVISVELDPRGLSPRWIGAMAAVGVTRASLGVQTLAPEVQRAIGRVQPVALIAAAVERLRAAGIGSLNMDLMYGLPGQGLAELEETLAGVAAMAPERIALFGYAHVPHLIPRQRRIDAAKLPDASLRFRQAELGHRFLAERGYQTIGFDHFALPTDAIAEAARTGMLRRNFQGFTEDRSDRLVGLGASAISSFPDLLVQNEKNAGRYRMMLSAGRLPAARGIVRDADDRLRAGIIEALLCRGEADTTGLRLDEVRHGLRPFCERGLVAIEGTRVRLLRDALPYARAIAATFDAYRRQPQPRRFSNAI